MSYCWTLCSQQEEAPLPLSRSYCPKVIFFFLTALMEGIPEGRILFLNLLSAPEGIAAFKREFPKLRIVTAFVDEGLDSKKYLSKE
jgi:hypothetical protein